MKILTVFAMLGLSACAVFDRHPSSGYYNLEDTNETAVDLYRAKALNAENEAREELGMLGKTLNENERTAIETRLQLKRKEQKLANRREKQQYFQLRSSLRSDRERLYFLSLPSFEARERWASHRGLASTQDVYTDEVAKTIDANDISLGMSQKAVTESWGDPDAVEVAGDPVYGFERWKYNRYISGNDGYQKEMRIVYFEGGKVVGWERQ